MKLHRLSTSLKSAMPQWLLFFTLLVSPLLFPSCMAIMMGSGHQGSGGHADVIYEKEVQFGKYMATATFPAMKVGEETSVTLTIVESQSKLPCARADVMLNVHMVDSTADHSMMHMNHGTDSSGMTQMAAGEQFKKQEAMKVVYTCPMHPDVKSEKPGDCPKCGMGLVLAEKMPVSQANDENKRQLSAGTEKGLYKFLYTPPKEGSYRLTLSVSSVAGEQLETPISIAVTKTVMSHKASGGMGMMGGMGGMGGMGSFGAIAVAGMAAVMILLMANRWF